MIQGYKSRRHQNEAFLREACKEHPEIAELALQPVIRKLMRDAAVCGAAEERSRTLGLIRQLPWGQQPRDLARVIQTKAVHSVLGYKQ